jgi:hypothetical protein
VWEYEPQTEIFIYWSYSVYLLRSTEIRHLNECFHTNLDIHYVLYKNIDFIVPLLQFSCMGREDSDFFAEGRRGNMTCQGHFLFNNSEWMKRGNKTESLFNWSMGLFYIMSSNLGIKHVPSSHFTKYLYGDMILSRNSEKTVWTLHVAYCCVICSSIIFFIFAVRHNLL